MGELSNRSIVEQVYAAFRKKDLAAILSLQSPEAEWSVAASADLIPWASPGPGHTGVSEFLRVLSQWLIADVFEIRTYVAEGETVVALGFQQGTVRPTRTPYAFEFVHVWTVAAGQVRTFRVYYDTAYLGSVLRAGEQAAVTTPARPGDSG